MQTPGAPTEYVESGGSRVVRRLIESMNQLLYPEPIPEVPEPVVPARPPDSVYHDAIYASSKIDMRRVRALAMQGIPVEYRAVYWKLLLGYLPPERDTWPAILMEGRNRYKSLVESAYAEPKDTAETDHPLSTSSDSLWQAHFNDKEMREVIQRDVARTVPELRFFCNADRTNTVHGTSLNNILFVYAKSNGKVRYVQGMNELAAQIYIVFATTGSEDDRKHCEADSFSCFARLMGEVGETFNKDLDTSMLESYFTIGRFQALLAILDSKLYLNLKEKKIDPRFYALRWLSLLFSQEFPVADVERLWDSLFADDNRFNLLLFFACRIVMDVRQEILTNDFSKNLFLLQNLKIPDMELAIHNAVKLMRFTKPELLEPEYMMQYMKELNKVNMTSSDLLKMDDEALMRDIEIQKKRAAAATKQRAASDASSQEQPAAAAAAPEPVSRPSDSSSDGSNKAPVKEQKPTLRGALPEQFCTMPWHEQ